MSLTQQDSEQFWQDGFVIAKSMFDAEEVVLLDSAIRQDPGIKEKAMQLEDGEGGVASLAIWNDPGDDIFGMLIRCKRIVDSMELLLGSEVYHYHSKLTAKAPHSKGSWIWHQDYGYWYDNGIPEPNLASVMVAVDDTNKENGCLQIIQASHLLGLIKHSMASHQMGADIEQVEEILKTHNKLYVELSAGDAVFFHCNTLHRSDNNRSDRTRNVLLSSYNRADNSSHREHQHPNYTPLYKVADNAIKEVGLKGLGEGREYMPQPEF